MINPFTIVKEKAKVNPFKIAPTSSNESLGIPDSAFISKPETPVLSGPATISQGKSTLVEDAGKFLENTAKRAVASNIFGGLTGDPVPKDFSSAFAEGKIRRSEAIKKVNTPEGAQEAAINFSPIGALGNIEGKVLKNLLDKIAASKNYTEIAADLVKAGVPPAKIQTLAQTLTKVDKPQVISDLINGAKTSKVATEIVPKTAPPVVKAPIFSEAPRVPAKNTAESVNAAAEAAKAKVIQESTPLFQSTRTTVDQVAQTETALGKAEQHLTKASNQAAKEGRVSNVESLPTIISKAPTPVNERVNVLDYLRTPKYVLEKIGLGKEWNGLNKAYETYAKELPKNIDKITAWSKQVSAEGNTKIFNWLDGKAVQLDANETKVAKEIKSWLNQWADRLGMKHDERVTNYITHIFPAGKGGEINEELAKIIKNQIPGSVYDPFLLQRQGAEGFIQDTWAALDAYVKTATRKIHMDPALADIKSASHALESSQEDYVKSYIDSVNMRPTKFDTAIDNGIKSVIGYRAGVRPTKNLTASARRIVSRAKLGLSVTAAMKNVTQGVNTFAELGTRYTTRGYIDLLKKGGKELKENGVLQQSFIEDRTYNAVKKFWEKADKAIFWNFEATEQLNRGAAYYGGKAKALAQGKTEQQAIEYGKEIAGKTQFLFGSIDTPVAMSSDIVKTLFQFQTFTVKQMEFIGQKMKNKEYASLARYVGASAIVYGAIGSAFGMSIWDVLPSLRFGVPPAVDLPNRLFKDITGAKDQYGNTPSGESRLRDAGNAILTDVVPGGAQIDRTFKGVSTVNKGKSTTAAGNFQYRVPKTTENYVRGALFGKSNLPETKAYYEKKGKAKSSSPNKKINPFKISG